jgi:hypothetical protein
MSTAVDSANLLLKLYELRREETMRAARNYMIGFDPKNVGEYMAGMAGPHSAHIRMVMSYWDMAASFVVNGAIDAKMFDEANGEHIMAFGKVEPFLAELREAFGSPGVFKNLEQVCTSAPGGIERVRAMRERMRQMMASRASSASQS